MTSRKRSSSRTRSVPRRIERRWRSRRTRRVANSGPLGKDRASASGISCAWIEKKLVRKSCVRNSTRDAERPLFLHDGLHLGVVPGNAAGQEGLSGGAPGPAEVVQL